MFHKISLVMMLLVVSCLGMDEENSLIEKEQRDCCHPVMECLVKWCCCLDPEPTFEEIFKEMQFMRVLDLSEGGYGVEDARSAARGLKNNKSIEELNFSYNNFQLEGVRAILEALKENDALIELDLRGNGFEPVDVIADVAKLARVNQTLKVLKIDEEGSVPQKQVNISLQREKSIAN